MRKINTNKELFIVPTAHPFMSTRYSSITPYYRYAYMNKEHDKQQRGFLPGAYTGDLVF